MGQIIKIQDEYYIEFFARGLLYSQKAGKTKEEAQKLLDETEKKIAAGEALTIIRTIDVDVFFDQFLKSARDEYGLKSHQRFSQMAEHFKKFLKENHKDIQLLSEITPKIIESYKRVLIKSVDPRILNFTLLLLREVMEHGIKLGFINDNPTLHIRLLNLSPKNYVSTRRHEQIVSLIKQGISFGKISRLLKFQDIARLMYFGNLFPLSREDMYN